MKILILGASGSIGGFIYNRLSGQYDVYGTYNENKPCDADDNRFMEYSIADLKCLDNILSKIKPNLIISSLAGDFKQQLTVHSRIAEFLKETAGRCIFISTANVFDGSPDGSKTERDAPYPISEYGKFKYSCEQLLQKELMNKCLVVRLPRTFIIENIDNEIKQVEKNGIVFNNLYMSYNTAENVVNAIEFCIESNKFGILHLSSNDSMLQTDFIELLLSNRGRNISYTKEVLTVEKYCGIFKCEDTSLLRYSDNGYFNLSIKSNDEDITTHFDISCKDIISGLE